MNISERAVIGRINRKLKDEGEQLHKCRPGRWEIELGPYYIKDIYGNFIVSRNIADLEELARELGVMNRWEKLAA